MFITNNYGFGRNPSRIFAQMSITNNQANTFAMTGTGIDTLVPPTGYSKITGFVKEVGKGGFDVSASAFIIPEDGWYQADGWCSFRHSANNSTVAIVFGITPPGGPLAYSPRPTPAKVPNVEDIGLIAGGGTFYAKKGTLVDARAATNNTGTVTIPNATIRIWQMVPGAQ